MLNTEKICASVKESTVRSVKDNMDAKGGRLDKGMSSSKDRPKLSIAIVARHPTTDEQHRFQAATDALLTELVRQQLGRGSKQ